jgi:D-glycero-D-manno-heptose 1,7-bisphosphate phosphatase
MPIKSIFLDRDGVINKELNYLYKIEEFKFIDGIFEACMHYLALDFKIIIISNQSGIARGLYSEKDYQILTDWMLKKFKRKNIEILDVFHCPHLPEANCRCRKPKPGMIMEAKITHNIDMKKSWMIGDKETDITAANNAGISKTILLRSGHKIDESISSAKFILDSILDSRAFINC